MCEAEPREIISNGIVSIEGVKLKKKVEEL